MIMFLAVVHAPGGIADRRGGEDQGQVVLALQPLLDDLQVQQSQETAAKAEPQGGAAVFLVDQRCVVELELFQGPIRSS
jgi:hypothetical protein